MPPKAVRSFDVWPSDFLNSSSYWNSSHTFQVLSLASVLLAARKPQTSLGPTSSPFPSIFSNALSQQITPSLYLPIISDFVSSTILLIFRAGGYFILFFLFLSRITGPQAQMWPTLFVAVLQFLRITQSLNTHNGNTQMTEWTVICYAHVLAGIFHYIETSIPLTVWSYNPTHQDPLHFRKTIL